MMSKTKLQRVAFVRLSPQGKSYAMRCDREDLAIGDKVEVEMYAGTDRAFIIPGQISSVSFHRWECSCHVLNHIDEVSYSIDKDFELTRIVDLTVRSSKTNDESDEYRSKYYSTLPDLAKSDLKEIYDAIAPEDGEDAYLGDGIWIRSDYSTIDEGR